FMSEKFSLLNLNPEKAWKWNNKELASLGAPVDSATDHAGSAAPIDRQAEIERLAALETIDYEAARTNAAELLGVRAQVLDSEVKKTSRKLGLEIDKDDLGQGRRVTIKDVLPWHEPVDGDELATLLAAAVQTYLVLSTHAAHTIALWVLHTWIVNDFTMSPRL